MKVVVFCGSGGTPELHSIAHTFGQDLAQAKHRLVYGGSSMGLMGALAHGAHGKGAFVEAISLSRFASTPLFTERFSEIFATTLRERQQKLIEAGESFVLLPGGLGSMYEIMDLLSLMSLQEIPQRPILIYNHGNYWGHLLGFLNHAVAQQCIQEKYLSSITVAERREQCLQWLLLPGGSKSKKIAA
jgi:uncharacterized protein (TIGR00730 family)